MCFAILQSRAFRTSADGKGLRHTVISPGPITSTIDVKHGNALGTALEWALCA